MASITCSCLTVEASGGLEMQELREELQLARQQRRAAMQAGLLCQSQMSYVSFVNPL